MWKYNFRSVNFRSRVCVSDHVADQERKQQSCETFAARHVAFLRDAPRCKLQAQLGTSELVWHYFARESKPFEARKWNGYPRRIVESVVKRREKKKEKNQEKKRERQEPASARNVCVPVLNYACMWFRVRVCLLLHSLKFSLVPNKRRV